MREVQFRRQCCFLLSGASGSACSCDSDSRRGSFLIIQMIYGNGVANTNSEVYLLSPPPLTAATTIYALHQLRRHHHHRWHRRRLDCCHHRVPPQRERPLAPLLSPRCAFRFCLEASNRGTLSSPICANSASATEALILCSTRRTVVTHDLARKCQHSSGSDTDRAVSCDFQPMAFQALSTALSIRHQRVLWWPCKRPQRRQPTEEYDLSPLGRVDQEQHSPNRPRPRQSKCQRRRIQRARSQIHSLMACPRCALRPPTGPPPVLPSA